MIIMRTENKIIAIIISVVLFYVFVQHMFQLSIMTGIGFIISCGLAFYKGVIFKEPRIVG